MAKKSKSQPSQSQLKAIETKCPLKVRKPERDEGFYLTGRGVLQYCIELEERIGPGDVTRHQFCPVVKPVFGPLIPNAKPVLFYEAISEWGGERFAYPRVLGEDYTTNPTWRDCEEEAFSEVPFGHWIEIEWDREDQQYIYGICAVEVDDLVDSEDFVQQLDAILMPNAVTTKDHPIYQYLVAMWGGEEDLIG